MSHTNFDARVEGAIDGAAQEAENRLQAVFDPYSTTGLSRDDISRMYRNLLEPGEDAYDFARLRRLAIQITAFVETGIRLDLSSNTVANVVAAYGAPAFAAGALVGYGLS